MFGTQKPKRASAVTRSRSNTNRPGQPGGFLITNKTMDLLQEITNSPGLDVVRIINLDSQGRVLLVQEVDDVNWKLPGGKMDKDESVLNAAIREIKEELGYDLDPSEIKNIVKALIPDSPNYRYMMLTQMDASKFKPTDEVAQTGSFALDDLPETKFSGHITSAVKFVS